MLEQPVDIPRHARHRPPGSSWSDFVATATMLPVLSVTALPLSVAYQSGKALWNAVQPSSDRKQKDQSSRRRPPPLDSGHVPSKVIPRPKRRYDVVLLGVTGFTGRLAARYLAQTYNQRNSRSQRRRVKWAMAGRSRSKLEALQRELIRDFGGQWQNNDEAVPELVVVDTLVPETLPQLVAHARVVATTAGPYGLYGSHVVEFCAKYGTHYVDITGTSVTKSDPAALLL